MATRSRRPKDRNENLHLASDPHVIVCDMPWGELVERVAAKAAAGSQRARRELELLVAEDKRAREEGREPDVISRLACVPVLYPSNPRPAGRKETHDG